VRREAPSRVGAPEPHPASLRSAPLPLRGRDFPATAQRATEQVPGIPRDAEGPVFREPWEAQAFAMALALHERGLFTWSEWAQTLGEEIRRAQRAGDPDTGGTYYRHWLAALERLVAAKGVASTAMLARYRDAWDRAADRTPHGAPIELTPGDFDAASR
jgi:nitrile hydratase accessory protein